MSTVIPGPKVFLIIVVCSLLSGCMFCRGLPSCGRSCVSEAQCLAMASGSPTAFSPNWEEPHACGCPCAGNVRTASVTAGKRSSPAAKAQTTKWAMAKKNAAGRSSSSRASMKMKSAEERSGDPQVKAVQQALNDRGARLRVDGIMGENTVRLLKAFQTINDLPVSGRPDKETLTALGLSDVK